MATALLPSIIRAQSITVADGTATNQHLPFYGGMAETDQHSQMIYPANLLTALPDRPIYAISFYTTSSDVFSFANFTIKMGEVSATNFTSASFSTPPSTTVYSGTLSVANNRMTISLSNPYIYHGGNLMIDFSHIGASWHSYSFQGISSTGGSIYKYSTNNPDIQNFLPKITFHCIPEQGTNTYVATNGNDIADGTSWETAKATIQTGCYAAGNGGTVFVKAGQYNISNEVSIPAGTTVLGGYRTSSTGTDTSQRRLPGTNINWDDASYCTIINGDRTQRIATVGDGAHLGGCVLQNGTTSANGGGVLIDGGTLQHCVVRWCDAVNDNTADAKGGGVFVKNDGQVLNCVITECRADNGSALAGEDGVVTNNTITRNWPANCGTVEDYDGNLYHTVVIGDQCWTRENMRTTHYADGTVIPRNTSGNIYASPYYYYGYDSDELLVDYGFLYNWAAVMNGASSTDAVPSGVQGVCPNGWHVPSNAEWDVMLNFVKSFPRYRCNNGSNDIAKALASRLHWNSSSTTCEVGNNQSTNNATLFSIMPTGFFLGNNRVYDVGYCSFLSSTTLNGSRVRTKYWNQYNSDVQTSDRETTEGYSVRCIKD